MSYTEQQESILHHLQIAPDIARVFTLTSGQVTDDVRESVEPVLSAVARFAQDKVHPVNAVVDRTGAVLVDGRVRMPEAMRSAMGQFVSDGWPGLSASGEWGGFDLPLAVQAGCQELIDRACPAFGMLPGLLRSGARLLETHATEAIKSEWLPRLASGDWALTICVSEPDAGSDVGRLRTWAERDAAGEWKISGEKIWISFGDHDLSARIGHCLLARSDRTASGLDGLSLFLVPDTVFESGGESRRNHVYVRRVEEKLGLHASPTCALGFEAATGYLIGKEGRGLQTLFAMIGNLRLSVAVQGLGIASGALGAAVRYACERRQGGPSDSDAVPIDTHIDVQRMLMEMASRVEVTRGLVMALSTAIDMQRLETDPEEQRNYAAYAAFLMPIAKTWGAETAFDVSHMAIQVFGGAGYTREWPVEQSLRDARVFSIYEGTSGIQALDLLHRRLWRDERRGLNVFLMMARADLQHHGHVDIDSAERFGELLELLDASAGALTPDDVERAEAGAAAFLSLAAYAVTGWIAFRCLALQQNSATSEKAAVLGKFWLTIAPVRARALRDELSLGADRLTGYAQVRQCFV